MKLFFYSENFFLLIIKYSMQLAPKCIPTSWNCIIVSYSMEYQNGPWITIVLPYFALWLVQNLNQSNAKLKSIPTSSLMFYCTSSKLPVWTLSPHLFVIMLTFVLINPLILVSDQDKISPYYIYTISCRQVMRIKKNINHGITNWSNTKFSKLK